MSAYLFYRELLREHLDELASLYDYRQERLCDWDSTPDDVAEVEARMDAHLDALVLGGEATLSVVLAALEVTNPWGYYAFVALACRLDRLEYLRVALLVVKGFCEDTDDPRAAATLRQAVADALVHHLPDERAERVAELMRDAGPHVVPVLATCIGARCWVQAAPELRQVAALGCADPVAVLRAVAQLPGASSKLLLANLRHPDAAVAQVAAIGALRRGETTTFDVLVRDQAPWGAVPLAMGGGGGLGPWLVEAARGSDPAQALLALGVLGDPAHLDVLIARLQELEHAPAAALGLFLMTGALLGAPEGEGEGEGDAPERGAAESEEDGPDDGELDDEADAPGWLSLAGSGISTDPAAWAAWMDAYRHRLRPGQRHRLGELATAHGDLALLSGSSLPLWLRRLLADEFVIRYGVQWAYEPDLLVARQREIVGRVRARLDDPRLRFTAGAWHFQGRIVE